MSRWLSGKETPKEWVQCFRIAHLKYTKESKPSISHPVSTSEFEIKMEFAKKAEAYLTPLKRKTTGDIAWSLTYTPYSQEAASINNQNRSTRDSCTTSLGPR
jgi:hypothetical protein